MCALGVSRDCGEVKHKHAATTQGRTLLMTGGLPSLTACTPTHSIKPLSMRTADMCGSAALKACSQQQTQGSKASGKLQICVILGQTITI
jgi:hypothetical protein